MSLPATGGPIVMKFIKSGFIKHVDSNFLLFLQETFLMHSRRPDKDIENFVDLSFQRYIRFFFKKMFFVVLLRQLMLFWVLRVILP